MKRIYWMITLLLLFSLALAACGGGEEPAPTVAATAVPPAEAEAPAEAPAEAEAEAPAEAPAEASPTEAAEPTAAPVPAEEPEAAPISFADLNFSGKSDDLESYRYEMIMTISGVNDAGEPVSQGMTMQMAFIKDPAASSIVMVSDGIADMEDMGSIEMVQIGNTSYMVMPEMGCLALPAEEEDLMQSSMADEFTPEAMFNDLEKLDLVGDDEINGIPVLHYTYDESAIPAGEAQGITKANGDIFVAKDGGFLVRMVSDMEGDSTFMEGFEGIKDAVMHIEFNMTDINAAFEILPPAGCEGQGPDAEPPFPVLEDATDLFNFPGMMSYSTAVSAEDAITFYQEAMAEAGYTFAEDESFITTGLANLVFNSETLGAVSISISENNGVTSIAVLSETNE